MMLLLVAPALAGLLDALSMEERQVRICQDAAAPVEAEHDYARAAGIWEACLGECRRLGYEGAAVMLEDQLALSRAMAKAAEWRASDPNRFALDVLSVAATQVSVEYPTDAVAETFRAWTKTEGGKGRLEPVRTVTVQWEGGGDPHASELVRRYVQDLGLKWADPGDPDVDVIVFATLTRADLEPRQSSRMGSLARAQADVRVDRVRFPRLDRTQDGFTATAAAESAEKPEAREEALRAACERAAAQVLKAVLRAVFA